MGLSSSTPATLCFYLTSCTQCLTLGLLWCPSTWSWSPQKAFSNPFSNQTQEGSFYNTQGCLSHYLETLQSCPQNEGWSPSSSGSAPAQHTPSPDKVYCRRTKSALPETAHFLVDSRRLQAQLPSPGALLTCLQRLSSNTSVKRSLSYLIWVRYLYSIYYFLYYSPQHTVLSLVFLPSWLQASWATQRQVTFLIHYIFTYRSSANETPLTITSAKTVQDIISYWEKEAKKKKRVVRPSSTLKGKW